MQCPSPSLGFHSIVSGSRVQLRKGEEVAGTVPDKHSPHLPDPSSLTQLSMRLGRVSMCARMGKRAPARPWSLKDSSMPGGRVTGTSAGPREHLLLQVLRHSSKTSGPKGRAVVSANLGTVSPGLGCSKSVEPLPAPLLPRMGTVEHHRHG